ncbi:MAG: DUF2764 family protein [Phycisphaerae bacterium]|nr:DUF2764 family protein [Phycisphaerae bacterium]
MAGTNYYLLSFLSTPEALGAEPPILRGDFLHHLDAHEQPRPRELAETIFLSDDLLQRDAVLAGEIDDPEPVILTVDQLRDEEPLPDFLAGRTADAGADTNTIAADVVWEAYFRHVAVVAGRLNSPFLRAWVGFEVALRNELAEARARALELEPTDYYVAQDLADAGDLSATFNEWAAAANPLQAQRVLDQARLDWLNENDAYFTFGDDELAAYAAKLILAIRWHRLARAMEGGEEEGTGDSGLGTGKE